MAVQSKEILDYTFTAENDLSTKQYHFVEVSGAWQIDVCDAATDRTIGVLYNEPAAGQAATIRMLGIALVISNGSAENIAAGNYVGPNAGGTAVLKGTADHSVAGIALAASTTSGAIIPVFLTPGAFWRSAAG